MEQDPPSTPFPPASPVPPPLTPPPVITPPPTPKRGKSGRGWMVLALILLLLLGISVLFNIGSIFAGLVGGRSSHYVANAGPRLEEATLEDHDAAAKILVIPVDGIITGHNLEQGFSLVDIIKAQLRRAEEDAHVKAVILKVDSPGGEVLASDDIYRLIANFQAKANKPVVASMGSLAASGGYYISAPCRWIVANELTITGSIGVIMSSWNYRGLMDKVGLVPKTYKSGAYKDMLSGSRDPNKIPPEEEAMVQALINETYGKFKSVVQKGRDDAFTANAEGKDKNRRLSQDWEKFADGRVLSGSEALKLGFVDELGGFDDAVARASKLAGVSKPNLIEYHLRFDLSDFFRLFGKSEAKSIKVDVGLDAPRLQAGKLYFLSPTFLQ